MTTDRTDFNQTWLTEEPQRTVLADYYGALVFNIQDLISHGKKPINVTDTVKKIKLNTAAYYWYEIDNEIKLAVELTKKPRAYQVRVVGKQASLHGKPPYATDLYNIILNDTKRPIKILSDTLLTDGGFQIWKQLYKDGHVISVYNTENPGQSFKTLDSEKDFDNYFGSKHELRDYIFVLNESSFLAETRSYFNTRRLRELSGLDVND